MRAIKRNQWSAVAGLSLLAIVAMCDGSEARALLLTAGELDALRGGSFTNCARPEPDSRQDCTDCIYDGNGRFVKCDEPQQETVCVSYTSETDCWGCEKLVDTCPGNLDRYEDMDCTREYAPGVDVCNRLFDTAYEQQCAPIYMTCPPAP